MQNAYGNAHTAATGDVYNESRLSAGNPWGTATALTRENEISQCFERSSDIKSRSIQCIWYAYTNAYISAFNAHKMHLCMRMEAHLLLFFFISITAAVLFVRSILCVHETIVMYASGMHTPMHT